MKTYQDQIHEHFLYLRSVGLNIDGIKVGCGWIRAQGNQNERCSRRGELAYRTDRKDLVSGATGLISSCRGPGGWSTYKTYGYGPEEIKLKLDSNFSSGDSNLLNQDTAKNAARKAYGFWKHSQCHGTSPYLEIKKVGFYGVRFRDSKEYGKVAVVPLKDINGQLWNVQMLNPNGTKRFITGARVTGLFHNLQPLKNGSLIGIAESYVTAATCFACTGIDMVCAFSSSNIRAVVNEILNFYIDSPLIVFADNDRHLEVGGNCGKNAGLLAARECLESFPHKITVVSPDFKDFTPCRSRSDWNDYFILFGKNQTINILGEEIVRAKALSK